MDLVLFGGIFFSICLHFLLFVQFVSDNDWVVWCRGADSVGTLIDGRSERWIGGIADIPNSNIATAGLAGNRQIVSVVRRPVRMRAGAGHKGT